MKTKLHLVADGFSRKWAPVRMFPNTQYAKIGDRWHLVELDSRRNVYITKGLTLSEKQMRVLIRIILDESVQVP